ncbi:NAD-dependent epimerase/dehydratase [Magnetococcus marinus MC-1]|uniref:GDP-mannose 4,6-dehydratase n=1 Tax=Magnetococcus marinus (strain ATCC BAA-1437 / JCM 17883 / MC-1) TaxID=156889 RepID=A0LAE2_MAGMM|nr:GDP-mannose 4,6-dehydratase [Magnetococcus marinus]ABK44935.1 NAD-dependent epimerase/dehydratase [Magnetococcus marinus MC-1]
MKTALICGVTGQDGAWLALLLLSKGYRVVGTSRDAQIATLTKLDLLGVRERIELRSMTPTDFRSVVQTLIQVEPDEIYNLSGQSSVGLSFQQPVETLESISQGTLNLLESMRMINKSIRFYNAGSSECFGDTGDLAADELTPFRPRSPYAVAKSASVWSVSNYREGYAMYACSGILFNHESWLRPARFVTSKVIKTVNRIAQGSGEQLQLGNMDISRDWGWAPEYVEAMWRILQQEKPEDFIIATGYTASLQEFVALAFAAHNLDWRDHTRSDASLLRETDIRISRANPQKARERLGWQATLTMPDVVARMVEAEKLLSQRAAPCQVEPAPASLLR